MSACLEQRHPSFCLVPRLLTTAMPCINPLVIAAWHEQNPVSFCLAPKLPTAPEPCYKPVGLISLMYVHIPVRGQKSCVTKVLPLLNVMYSKHQNACLCSKHSRRQRYYFSSVCNAVQMARNPRMSTSALRGALLYTPPGRRCVPGNASLSGTCPTAALLHDLAAAASPATAKSSMWLTREAS